MPVIDEQGRLFGRINIIDAMVAIFVVLLVPLAYGAFLLFRVPEPTVSDVNPARIPAHQSATIELVGDDLRPFLRVRFGTVEAANFLIESPQRAEVKVPELPAGTYDLVLYDEGRELFRKRAAVTVAPPPPPPAVTLHVIGRFVDLTTQHAEMITVGSNVTAAEPGNVARVEDVLPWEPSTVGLRVGPEKTISVHVPDKTQVPAVLSINCQVVLDECKLGGSTVARDEKLTFSLRTNTPVTFVIDDVRAASGDARQSPRLGRPDSAPHRTGR